MTKRMRGFSLSVVAAVCALGLVGCVTIPDSGPVLSGREVSEQELPGRAEVIPEGPVAGSDQETLLRGFISAYSGSGNYDTARQFLTDRFARDWDPRESVLIRSGNDHIDRSGDQSLTYSILNSAVVDRDGVYSTFATVTQALSYEFTQEDGEWRISAAPNGIVLTSGTFTRLFAEHSIYFLDPIRRSLVPDLRWFPAQSVLPRIVSAVLEGPPSWLQGAVGTAFPEGTTLLSPRRVPVETGVAVIDLSKEALTASEQQRQFMRAQLEASLAKLPTVTSIQMTVAGSPLSIAPLGANAPQLRPQIDSRVVVVRDGEFGYLSNDTVSQIEGLSDKVIATHPTAATLGVGATSAVTRGDEGVYLIRSSVPEPTLVDSRPNLIAPDLDNHGYVWSAQQSSPNSIRVIDTAGNSFPVTTPLPKDSQLVAMAVSRDGARVALLVNTSAGPRMIVSAIIRDQNRDQVPLSIGEPRLDETVGSGTAIDVTWLDEVTVATLTSSNSGKHAITAYEVGGKSRDLGDPGAATAIVGGVSESGLRVLGVDGSLGMRRVAGWQSSSSVALIAGQR